MGRAGTIAGAFLVALLASCTDRPERASEPVDTAVLQDRRIFEGEVGRDTAGPADDSTAADSMPVAAAPIFVLTADSAAGFLLYHRKAGCNACHGADGAGLANLGPSLRDSVWLHIDGSPSGIERVIRNGIGRPIEAAIAMPALASRLEPEEVQRVVAYVYAISHPGSAVADTAEARRDSAGAAADSVTRDTLARGRQARPGP